MSELPRGYDADKQPEYDNGEIDIKLSPEQTAVVDRALRLFALNAMTDTDSTLSEVDAAIVVALISRDYRYQLKMAQSPEKFRRLVEILRSASIPTDDPDVVTAADVADDIEATVAISLLGGSFDDVTAEDFNF